MNEQPDQPEIQTFVRRGPDGEERTHHFAPWPTDDGGQPSVRVMMVEVPSGGDGEGGGELRHLSYEDPPGAHMGVTPDAWRAMLAQAVAVSDSEAEFVEMMVLALGRDLVMSHGVQPVVAIQAVMEFARKVYAEFSGII